MATTPAKPDLFREALKPVLVHEGGKVNHPKDPGGKTNKGITQRVYNGWLGKNNRPSKDVYDITDEEVEAIYRYQFWDVIRGDNLPRGVGYVIFDGAVHSGSKQSVKWLQRALGFEGAAVDGVLGAITMDKVGEYADYDALITGIIDRRETFLRALKTWPTFGKGWLRRIMAVEKLGQAWASGSVGPKVEYIPDANQKATIEDAKKPPTKAPGDLAAGGGVVTGGGGAVLDQVKGELGPFAAKLPWVGSLIVWLIIIGAVIAVGGIAWRWYAMNRTKQLEDALDVKVS